MRPQPLLAAAFSLLLPAAGLAQTAAGTVHGFAGEVADRVHVRGLDAERVMLAEGTTDAAGVFTLHGIRPIAFVEARIEGVLVEVVVPAANATALAVSFAEVAHVTRRGELRDPAGGLAAGVDLLCRDARRRAIVTLTTDERGTFTLRTNQDVHDLVVDPIGWRHVVPGPFATDASLAIDLRQHASAFFRLHGAVTDDQGRAAAAWWIVARDAKERIARAKTRDDGTYTLWCTRAVTIVEAGDGMPRLGRIGPWTATADLALDERQHALALVTGRFVDAGGNGITGAMVFPAFEQANAGKGVRPVAVTDSSGRFAARLVPGTPNVFVISKDERHQAFAALPFDGKPLELRAK